MEDKILGFQFEPVSAKRIQPSYNNGSDQDEPETRHNRLSSQEFCNCQNCKQIPTRLECVCYHEIPQVKAFHLKGKARLLEYSCSGIYRISRSKLFFKKGVLKNLAIFTGKHLCWSSF